MPHPYSRGAGEATFFSLFVPKCSRIWAAEAPGFRVHYYLFVGLSIDRKGSVLVKASLWAVGFTTEPRDCKRLIYGP